MQQRHKNCEIPKCAICMEDHLAVGDRLDALTGNSSVDHLGKFHAWLAKQGIEPETEHGWGTEACFDDALMQQYADTYKA